jgi:hypothetical protein
MRISRRDFEGKIKFVFDWFDCGEGLNFWTSGKVRIVEDVGHCNSDVLKWKRAVPYLLKGRASFVEGMAAEGGNR